MTNGKSKNPIKQERERKRLRKLDKEGRLVAGVVIPEGSLPANPDRQDARGGYSGVRYYYQDIEFSCDGCRVRSVWTAEQQKRYYEDQKGNIYNEPKWCHGCHRERMKKRDGGK